MGTVDVVPQLVTIAATTDSSNNLTVFIGFWCYSIYLAGAAGFSAAGPSAGAAAGFSAGVVCCWLASNPGRLLALVAGTSTPSVTDVPVVCLGTGLLDKEDTEDGNGTRHSCAYHHLFHDDYRHHRGGVVWVVAHERAVSCWYACYVVNHHYI
jgi:hypothetical protein